MSVHGKCYDVGMDSNELSSGRNEGVKTPRKKGTENIENRFYIVCAPTKRATEACGSRDNTEYFPSGEATTLNTSWMEQNHVMRSQLLKKWSCRRQHDISVRVLAGVDVTSHFKKNTCVVIQTLLC